MSYLFDGSGDSLDGAFTSTYSGEGLTLACFIKIANHPESTTTAVMLGNNSGDQQGSHALKFISNADRFGAQSDAAGSTANATVDLNVDGVWAAFVGTITSDARRDVYLSSISNTGSNTATRNVPDALQHIRIGRQLGGSQIVVGRIAEVAMWNTVLDSTQITNYMAGNVAAGIAAANLIGYWPLNADGVLTNLGIDAGGDLSATGAVFDADHPTITGGASIARLAHYYNSLRAP